MTDRQGDHTAAAITKLMGKAVGRRHTAGDGTGDGVVRVKIKHHSPLRKKTRRGFRGYPVATVAFYGPDDRHATKVAVGIVTAEGSEPSGLERWYSDDTDVRTDAGIGQAIVEFIESRGVKSVVMADRILGCPHEEGTDYPDGQVCPRCSYWAHRDRFSGEVLH